MTRTLIAVDLRKSATFLNTFLYYLLTHSQNLHLLFLYLTKNSGVRIQRKWILYEWVMSHWFKTSSRKWREKNVKKLFLLKSPCSDLAPICRNRAYVKNGAVKLDDFFGLFPVNKGLWV